MFDQLLSYDPTTIAPRYREMMAGILRARGEYLRASAEVIDLRGRSWAGEEGLTDTIDLRAADLARLRENYMEKELPFLQEVVSLDALKSLMPMLLLGALNTFKVPLPVIAESFGVDVDAVKLLIEAIKELIEEVG